MTGLADSPLDDWDAYDRARFLTECRQSAPPELGLKSAPVTRRAPPLVELMRMKKAVDRGQYQDDTDPPTAGAVILGE